MKSLRKSSSKKIFFGVCGGIAEYFHCDVTIIRIIFVFFGLSVTGIFAYALLAAIIPDEDE